MRAAEQSSKGRSRSRAPRAATTPERVWRELQLRRRFANWLAAHPLRANGLLDDHHAALDQPTQNDLRGGLAVTPISVSVGSVKRLFRPSANGPHDSICMPWSLINRCSAVR
jgi:hypothetical protein